MAKKKRPAAKKADKEQGSFDPPLPDRRAMERVMRQLAANLGGEEREETPLDRAQEVMYRAFEAPEAEQVRLARQAMEISPDCADAYVMLAERAKTAYEAQELYAQGVAAGERALGRQAFVEHEGHFWGILETRPYMRARQGLAQCLWEAGRREEAAAHYQEMLRLNPNDNQGVRYSLATLLLDMDRDDDLRRLLTQYEDDALAEWAYTKALVAFREGGETAQANRLLAQAVKVNKHVPAYLLGHKELPHDLPPHISVGGNDEAASYAVGNRRAWLNTPGAISWLRKTLNVPLPKAPKRRRPSWPELRLVLRRCPQERGEVWQVDTMPSPVAGQPRPEKESPWVVVVVGRGSQELLDMEVFDSQPKPAEVWDYLTDVMRKPRHAESHRPTTIEVRQKVFQAAWMAKLKQIGVECVLSEHLDAVDLVRDRLAPVIAEAGAEETGAVINPEELFSLPVEPGEVWQADVRPMPAWITGEGEPYRPWVAVVVNRTDDLVLAHQAASERPSAEWLWEAILQAIRQPAIGEPHRPGLIEVGSAEQREALLPHLDRAGIECVTLKRLEHMDSVLESMAQHLAGQGGPPSMLDAPGMELAQVGSFYAAAAEFYRRKPWQRVPGDTVIRVECDKFQSGPWYAVVMGQSGVQQGLAIYEDLAALQAMISGDASEEENSRSMSVLSMMFSEAFEISVRDLDAAEKQGWAVAGPEAYPMVIRVNPGLAMRPPLVWELELLEGCLRTIPKFLVEKHATLMKAVAVASGELTLRLAWVDGV
jgi:tetratricopeptide (TPR) repeat protein